ncbi:MAG: YiiX/YebB-like N1pC/P60 family cysteine hydrolase [Enhygromyxa sp.]
MATDAQLVDPRHDKLGRLLHRLGAWGFPGCVGAAIGFYLADHGTPWLPTTLALLLVVGALCLLAIAGGRALSGRAFRQTARGRVVRRRVLFAAGLAMAAGVSRLVLFWVEQPSPLTSLSSEDFDQTFMLDARNYHEYDTGIEHYLTLLEARPELFEPGAVLGADDERLLLDCWEAIYAYSFALDQIRIFYEDWYRFDPSRAQRSRHLRSFLLTFAAELSLYEKATRATALFGPNRNVVKFLDAPHPDRGLAESSFSSFRQELQGTRDAARVIAGKRYLRWLAQALHGPAEARALGCDWLWDRIERHLAVIEGFGVLAAGVDTLGSDSERLQRGVRRVWYPTQKGVAEWMGDTRVRRINWYLIDEELQAGLVAVAEPGDVLLARKNWYLSNVGLPGFWPHAILYIGDPQQFAAYFDDPEVRAWVRERSGEDIDLPTYLGRRWPARWLRYQFEDHGQPYRVIEAISEGVVFNTLDHAAGDYLVALRPRLSKVAKAQAIVEAFAYLDRPYDFNFDFATDHAIVCTELIYRAYRPAAGKPGLELGLVELAGRPTLPANDIARQYVAERGSAAAQFDFVYFIDAIEKQQKAVVSDEASFVTTPSRTKWDYRKQ